MSYVDEFEAIQQFCWNEEACSLAEVVEKHSFPQVIKLNRGYDGGLDGPSLGHGEFLTLHGVRETKKLRAEDRNGNKILVAVDCPYKCYILPRLKDCALDQCTVDQLPSIFPKVKLILVVVGHYGTSNELDTVSSGDFLEIRGVEKRKKEVKVTNVKTMERIKLTRACSAEFRPIEASDSFTMKQVRKRFGLPIRIRFFVEEDVSPSAELVDLVSNTADLTILEECVEELVVATSVESNLEYKTCYEIPKSLELLMLVTVQLLVNDKAYDDLARDFDKRFDIAKFLSLDAGMKFFQKPERVTAHKYASIADLFLGVPQGTADGARNNKPPPLFPRKLHLKATQSLREWPSNTKKPTPPRRLSEPHIAPVLEESEGEPLHLEATLELDSSAYENVPKRQRPTSIPIRPPSPSEDQSGTPLSPPLPAKPPNDPPFSTSQPQVNPDPPLASPKLPPNVNANPPSPSPKPPLNVNANTTLPSPKPPPVVSAKPPILSPKPSPNPPPSSPSLPTKAPTDLSPSSPKLPPNIQSDPFPNLPTKADSPKTSPKPVLPDPSPSPKLPPNIQPDPSPNLPTKADSPKTSPKPVLPDPSTSPKLPPNIQPDPSPNLPTKADSPKTSPKSVLPDPSPSPKLPPHLHTDPPQIPSPKIPPEVSTDPPPLSPKLSTKVHPDPFPKPPPKVHHSPLSPRLPPNVHPDPLPRFPKLPPKLPPKVHRYTSPKLPTVTPEAAFTFPLYDKSKPDPSTPNPLPPPGGLQEASLSQPLPPRPKNFPPFSTPSSPVTSYRPSRLGAARQISKTLEGRVSYSATSPTAMHPHPVSNPPRDRSASVPVEYTPEVRPKPVPTLGPPTKAKPDPCTSPQSKPTTAIILPQPNATTKEEIPSLSGHDNNCDDTSKSYKDIYPLTPSPQESTTADAGARRFKNRPLPLPRGQRSGQLVQPVLDKPSSNNQTYLVSHNVESTSDDLTDSQQEDDEYSTMYEIPAKPTDNHNSAITPIYTSVEEAQEEDPYEILARIPEDISELSITEVGHVLKLLHLGEYSEKFKNSDIDGSLMKNVSENHLESLGVHDSFHKTKILKFIGGWRPKHV